MKKKFIVNGQEIEADILSHSGCTVTLKVGNKILTSKAQTQSAKGQKTFVAVGHKVFIVEDYSNQSANQGHGANELIAPMPGKILKVFKGAGNAVKAGETLLVMEAMKMEHAIKAPHDGEVAKILYQVGEQVSGGALLVEMKESV